MGGLAKQMAWGLWNTLWATLDDEEIANCVIIVIACQLQIESRVEKEAR